MKCLFFCGSLEPGRDGVGDYVYRLTAELVRQGHEVSAIALNDPHLNQEFSSNKELAIGTVTILRLPASRPLDKRFARAKQWVDEFDADWLSLQFVPFAFHPKGLPFSLGKKLLNLSRGKLWHIMFHEVWIGLEKQAPVKHQLAGKLQQLIIKQLVLQLNPKVIHTHTQLYQIQLSNLGFTVHSLPLFGNIPVARSADNGDYASATKDISLVLFGGIHPGAPAKQLAQEVAEYAQREAIQATLILVGRCGSEAAHWVTAWQAAGLTVEVLGEQPAHTISKVLQQATLGLTTTPVALTEKSGTAAAMLEHGLPVLCVGRPWHPKGIDFLETPRGILVYKQGNFRHILAQTKVYLYNNVSTIAEQLVKATSV